MRIVRIGIGLLWAASAAAEVHYRLPWAEGRSFMFTQVPGGQITTHFSKATLHAVDIAMPEGVPVLAARAGIVEAVQAHHRAGPDEEPLTYEGNFVRVRHADGTAATYAHLGHQSVAVAVGEPIAAAQLLGYSGASGDVVAPHLHFVVTRVQENSAGWREGCPSRLSSISACRQ
jgi:murein DD-endopeptidase MepM/ murein hydrolase activator NlpD